MQEQIIWSNYSLDYEDWREYLEEEHPTLTEEERIDIMYETNDGYLEDTRVEYNIKLSRPIICIARLGLWNGNFDGYAELSNNVKDCFYVHSSSTAYCTWFIDSENDLCSREMHHDGSNLYVYRAYKETVTYEQIEALKEKIINSEATEEDIAVVTESIFTAIERMMKND